MTLQSRVGKCLANLLEEWCGGADLLSLETCQSYHCFLLTLKSYCSQIGLVPLANLSPELHRSSYVFSVSKFRFQKESTQGNELNWKKYIWRMGNAVAGTVEVRRGLQWVSMRICLGVKQLLRVSKVHIWLIPNTVLLVLMMSMLWKCIRFLADFHPADPRKLSSECPFICWFMLMAHATGNGSTK